MYQVRGNRDACKSVGPHPPCNLSVVSRVNRPLIRSIIEATSKTVARTRKTRDYISGLIMDGWKIDFIRVNRSYGLGRERIVRR